MTIINTMSKDDLLNTAKTCLEDCLKKLRNTEFAACRKPNIELNQRGKIAGAALLQKNIIRLHPRLFIQNKTYFVEQVIPHELAHLVVWQFYGRVRPHGQQWRYVMTEILGLEPHLHHHLDVKKAGVKLFTYVCQCNEVELSAVRHNRVQKNRQSYICKQCRQTLVYKHNLMQAE